MSKIATLKSIHTDKLQKTVETERKSYQSYFRKSNLKGFTNYREKKQFTKTHTEKNNKLIKIYCW